MRSPNCKFFAAPVLLATLALAACSGEPSNSDIEKAYQNSIDQANQLREKIPSPGGNFELHKVKKVSCKSANGSSGYNCDVELDMTMPLLGRTQRVVKVRMVKGDDGWVAVEQ